MTIVVDTSVAAKWFIKEAGREQTGWWHIAGEEEPPA